LKGLSAMKILRGEAAHRETEHPVERAVTHGVVGEEHRVGRPGVAVDRPNLVPEARVDVFGEHIGRVPERPQVLLQLQHVLGYGVALGGSRVELVNGDALGHL